MANSMIRSGEPPRDDGGLIEVSPAVRALGGARWGTAVWIGRRARSKFQILRTGFQNCGSAAL